MATPKFVYLMMYRGHDDEIPILPDEKPVNVLAGMNLGREIAVRWYLEEKVWMVDHFTLRGMLNNPWRYRSRSVDRATAERETPNFAETPLPSEDELKAMIEAAPTDPFAKRT